MSHVIPTTARVELSETAAAVGCVGGRRRRRRKEGRKTTATAGLRMETKEAGYDQSPGLISGFSGGKKKSQNKNFDDHITTI
jgi:hypothetical protein